VAASRSPTPRNERLTKVPADLDLKPYRDEHDNDLVQRMLACIARDQAPPGIKAKDVERGVGRYMPRVRDFKAKAKRKHRGLVRQGIAIRPCPR
jgi:hypothetical protein